MTSLLSITNLSFSYPDKKEILSNLNIEVNEEEKIAVVGPNGSGKTTLYLILAGILKPANGEILFNNTKIKTNAFNPGIAYLFQSPDDQLFSATLFDDIAFGPINMGIKKKEVLRRVTKALGEVSLTGMENKMPHHLSGGQKRLAALASILSMNPELLLLDEPTSNLDAKNRRQIIKIIKSLNKTMLVASHDLEFLLETCKRCIIINDSKIVADGDIKDILANETLLKKHHLEKPHSLIPHTHKKKIIGNPVSH